MIRIAFAILLALCGVASAQMSGGAMFPGPGVKAYSAAGYTGPGNIVGSAKIYLSCTRAYTAAYAASNGSACDLVRASDSTSCTMVFQTNGDADVATTSSCTGGTQTVTQFCNATTCKVSQAYDQTGNGFHFTQGTNNNRPDFDPAGAKVMVFTAAQNHRLANTGVGATNQVFSWSGVAKRTSGTSGSCILCASTGNVVLEFRGANIVSQFAGTFADAAQTDGSCHSFIGVVNGASSALTVDGSTTAGAAGASNAANNYSIGATTTPSLALSGTIREVILWASDITSSVSSLASNQTTYGGC